MTVAFPTLPVSIAPRASWDLSDVVGSLRAALASIVAGLRAALFPRHFGAYDLSDDGVDFFVGHTLDVNLRALVEQVRRGLRYESAGATVLGRVTIGRGSSIGGNVRLTRSVPPGSRITQAQVRTETFDEGAGI